MTATLPAIEIKLFDTQYRFLEETALNACWIGGRGCGKAQPVDEPVLTPSGWVAIGSLVIGDKVIGSDGLAHEVLGIFPQGRKKVYRVNFNDGTWTRACAEHLWKVNKSGWDKDKKRGKSYQRPWQIKTTEEIASLKSDYVLPQQPVVEFSACPVPVIDPWLLGFLIGDGCFRSTQITFASIDKQIVDRVSAAHPVSKRSGCNYAISDGGVLKGAITKMGLWGKYSSEKRLPQECMFWSIADRTALLHGLMDSDGTVDRTGRVVIGISSPGLADDIAELARSLGCVARQSVKGNRGYRGKDGAKVPCLDSHEVTINAPFNPFWLERKAAKWKPRTKYGQWKTFGEIVEDGEEECVCISVSAPDSLYITRGFTLTHNTFTLALWALGQCMKYPGCRGVVASSTNPQLKQATIPDFLNVFDLVGVQYEYSEWRGMVDFANGSSFKFQSLDVPEEQVKGGNLDFLGVDEVDGCPPGHISKLEMGTRGVIGSRQRRYVGNSPPPKSFLEQWYLPEVAARAGKKVKGPLYQASMFENYLLPQDFVDAALADNPPGSIEYRRWILGEMGVPLEGLVYREFEKRHIIPAHAVPWDRVIGYINALDFGANHFTVFLRAAVTDEEKIYIFAEHAARRTLLREHASEINRLLSVDPARLADRRPDLDPVGAVWADHDAQDRLELAALGIPTIPAVKSDKLVGINCVRQRFRDDSLFIVEGTTPQLLSEIPYYVWSPTKDEPVKENDDAVDCMRYLVGGFDIESPEVHL